MYQIIMGLNNYGMCIYLRRKKSTSLIKIGTQFAYRHKYYNDVCRCTAFNVSHFTCRMPGTTLHRFAVWRRYHSIKKAKEMYCLLSTRLVCMWLSKAFHFPNLEFRSEKRVLARPDLESRNLTRRLYIFMVTTPTLGIVAIQQPKRRLSTHILLCCTSMPCPLRTSRFLFFLRFQKLTDALNFQFPLQFLRQIDAFSRHNSVGRVQHEPSGGGLYGHHVPCPLLFRV